uniref:Uncharacterized protein n=1 Tax=Meloidogyne incognita TaxID=6306 RepID=A0A914LWJ2_MELIC
MALIFFQSYFILLKIYSKLFAFYLTFLTFTLQSFLLLKIPKFFSSPLTSLEVAKKVGLGNRFAFALDCLPFSEDGPVVVLVVDFLQMAQAKGIT